MQIFCMKTCDVLIVGGGPAGLRAAEMVSAAGWKTVLAEHKASVGRKFLVAGKGGLNLTHSEPVENFPARYGDTAGRWQKLLAGFSPGDLRAWAGGLDIKTFVGTSGRVFPETKQAAPLLRRWVARLRKQGVVFRLRHQLAGFRRVENGEIEVDFTTAAGRITLQARAVIFALGGASWPQTGSDGGWSTIFSGAGIRVVPFAPANCGYEVDWPEKFLAEAEGLPLKNVVVSAGGVAVAGELLITKYGLEGGRDLSVGTWVAFDGAGTNHHRPETGFFRRPIGGQSATVEKAPGAWRLSPVARALIGTHSPPASVKELAALVKAFPLTLHGPRSIAEAISSAGGVSWDELDDHLMLRRWPGIFCAGEMIDWEAPTGGYLLQGCFSTATRAAEGAGKFLTELTK